MAEAGIAVTTDKLCNSFGVRCRAFIRAEEESETLNEMGACDGIASRENPGLIPFHPASRESPPASHRRLERDKCRLRSPQSQVVSILTLNFSSKKESSDTKSLIAFVIASCGR